MTGTVYLVGAGPGDPGLITVKGRELLLSAEVLVYDYLADLALVALSPSECERIYVGKKGGDHTMSQEDINALLVSTARSGRSVVRLKGGDPFVFGRGGEEALELAKNGIAFEVVPGITSGIAAPAYAGIPLTHRGMAAAALLVTGHEAEGKEESDIDWAGIAKSKATLAFYMGVKNLNGISNRLMEHGRSADTPAALIRWGTTPRQESLSGTLGTIAAAAEVANFQAPAILIVGEVAALREKLRWFDTRPLFGKRIIVTRSKSTASSLAADLRREGAEVIEFPTISIEPVSADLDSLLPPESFDWYMFTSQNAVHRFFEELDDAGLDTRKLCGARAASVGTETAKALLEHGIIADVVPERQTSEGLLEKIDALGIDMTDQRICFPCSEIAGVTLPEGLTQRGAEVRQIHVYRTVSPDVDKEMIDQLLSPLPDAVTFTSASTVDNFVSALEAAGRKELCKAIPGVAIGPTTAAAVAKHGIRIACVSEEPSIESLKSSIVTMFKEKK